MLGVSAEPMLTRPTSAAASAATAGSQARARERVDGMDIYLDWRGYPQPALTMYRWDPLWLRRFAPVSCQSPRTGAGGPEAPATGPARAAAAPRSPRTPR